MIATLLLSLYILTSPPSSTPNLSDFSTYCGCNYTYFEDCTNGEDDDFDGFIDCEDADCQQWDSCPKPTGELCFTDEDEDEDGYIGCEDEDCISFYPCTRGSDPTKGFDDNLYGCSNSRTNGKSTPVFMILLVIFFINRKITKFRGGFHQ